MGRKPGLPVVVIWKIGACESLSSTGPVAALHKLRVFPAERGERHDSSVKPDVADLGDTAYALGSACRAADLDGVNPRAMELYELIHAGRREVVELGARTDDGDMAAAAREDRQGQAEVTAAGDVPIAHVPEPVVHPFAEVRRRPLDSCVGGKQSRSHLVDGDEPVVGNAEDERGVAPPAEGIAVRVLTGSDQTTSLGEIGHD